MHVVIAIYRFYEMHNFMNAAQRPLAYGVINIRFSFSQSLPSTLNSFGFPQFTSVFLFWGDKFFSCLLLSDSHARNA